MSNAADVETAPPKPHRTKAELAALAFERIRIVPAAGPLQARVGDRVIARSDAALELHETDHEVRIYFPRADVDETALQVIDETSHCPFKGDASDYWALAGDPDATPVAWSYPDPIPASAPIAKHIAFYETVIVEAAG